MVRFLNKRTAKRQIHQSVRKTKAFFPNQAEERFTLFFHASRIRASFFLLHIAFDWTQGSNRKSGANKNKVDALRRMCSFLLVQMHTVSSTHIRATQHTGPKLQQSTQRATTVQKPKENTNIILIHMNILEAKHIEYWFSFIRFVWAGTVVTFICFVLPIVLLLNGFLFSVPSKAIAMILSLVSASSIHVYVRISSSSVNSV